MLSPDFLLKTMLQIAMAMCLASITKGAKGEELSKDLRNSFPELTYQIINADHFLLKDSRQALMGNFTQQSQTQSFIITKPMGKPAINISFGSISVQQPIPLDLINTGTRVRVFTLTRQVRSASPIIHLLFYAATKVDNIHFSGHASPKQTDNGYICVTAYAFWKLQEIKGTCSISENGGFCLVKLRPEPAWFTPRSGRSSREHRASSRGTVVELYYQTRPSPTNQCIPHNNKQSQSPTQEEISRQQSGSILKKIGCVNLLRSPPGNPMFMRLRLGGAVIIQTSSKPLKPTDTATFYVFLSSISLLERFILRATVHRGLSFSTARPSDTQLWNISLEPGKPGITQTVFVTCQRKGAITAKRGLLEVLQLDFDAHEQGDPAQIQTITWRLERPGNPIRDEGTMRIYTLQRDYVGIAPFIMNSDLFNTAVLDGKMVSVPVKVLGVETDGSVSDITNSTRCSSTDEGTLKVSENCDYVYVNGKEARGRVRMMLNFNYSYLTTELEVNVWMPRLPLNISMVDSELSQIKGWRIPISGGNTRPSWDSEEDNEKKGRGCLVQYQHSQVQVLTAFTAEVLDSSTSSSENFLGPEWLVDVTQLIRSSLKVVDTSIAQLHRETVLSGRAPGITTVQVISPLSDLVLGERTVQVLDDRVRITDLSVQLVSGLSLSLQPSPGSNRTIMATATTQETMQNPKQEAVVACKLHFSDGSQAHLDLFDPSSYQLTVSSLDNRVVSVKKVPGSVMVAESEGWGLLFRAELTICEACQKSKRKSKLAVGAGTVRVKFLSSEHRMAQTEAKLGLTPFQGLLRRNTTTGMAESTARDFLATSDKTRLQEAIGVALSTIRIKSMTAIKPDSEKHLSTFSSGKDMLNISEFPYQPTQVVPIHKQDLVWTFGIFTHVEICIYLLLGLSCLAIIMFLINCGAQSARLHADKTAMQCQGPDKHTHHWVNLGITTEQSSATTSNQEQKVPITALERPNFALENQTERTATLGRRCSTLPLRTNSGSHKSAGPLAKPKRNEPLHSPTSKRNQVQFTTFTTLDIKHLAALKRNWLDFNWTNQNQPANQGDLLSLNREACESFRHPDPEGISEIPWPVVKPVIQEK